MVREDFWVSSKPYWNSSLMIVPSRNETDVVKSDIKFFDADGECFNKISIESPLNKVTSLDLDSLMFGCKFESGIKHAHLRVNSDSEVKHFCKNTFNEIEIINEKLRDLNNTSQVYYPLFIQKNNSPYIVIVNRSDEQSNLKCKFITGNRSPELDLSLNANSTEVFNLENLFSKYLNDDLPSERAYVRLTTTKGDFGVQLIEPSNSENFIFNSIC